MGSEPTEIRVESPLSEDDRRALMESFEARHRGMLGPGGLVGNRKIIGQQKDWALRAIDLILALVVFRLFIEGCGAMYDFLTKVF